MVEQVERQAPAGGVGRLLLQLSTSAGALQQRHAHAGGTTRSSATRRVVPGLVASAGAAGHHGRPACGPRWPCARAPTPGCPAGSGRGRCGSSGPLGQVRRARTTARPAGPAHCHQAALWVDDLQCAGRHEGEGGQRGPAVALSSQAVLTGPAEGGLRSPWPAASGWEASGRRGGRRPRPGAGGAAPPDPAGRMRGRGPDGRLAAEGWTSAASTPSTRRPGDLRPEVAARRLEEGQHPRRPPGSPTRRRRTSASGARMATAAPKWPSSRRSSAPRRRQPADLGRVFLTSGEGLPAEAEGLGRSASGRRRRTPSRRPGRRCGGERCGADLQAPAGASQQLVDLGAGRSPSWSPCEQARRSHQRQVVHVRHGERRSARQRVGGQLGVVQDRGGPAVAHQPAHQGASPGQRAWDAACGGAAGQ